MGDLEAGDEGLWARSLGGNGEAFGTLYDRHRDRVFRHAYRLAGSHHDAEDILASAFLELWRRRNAVRLVEGSVLPWLLITTTNVARNTARAARRYRRFLESLPRAESVSDQGDEDFFGRAQGLLDQDVASALRALKAEDLHLVVLVVFEEYTLSAAGAVLGLSPSAAKSRFHRARQRLKAALADARPRAVPAAPILEGEGA
ncbi:RNA polymerase sigma factor [Sinomonas mesophila]|uniref:RNA polymerase sigma factor n=1 Tax=Sinomonas mesophila TaxID=1531955 RepID=UPI000985C98E|nr:sigma-70 family RNA polymerase sigma factor [Sinomonas mesophila]